MTTLTTEEVPKKRRLSGAEEALLLAKKKSASTISIDQFHLISSHLPDSTSSSCDPEVSCPVKSSSEHQSSSVSSELSDTKSENRHVSTKQLLEILSVSPILSRVLSFLKHSQWLKLRRTSRGLQKLIEDRFATVKQIDISDLAPGTEYSLKVNDQPDPIMDDIAEFLGRIAPRLERMEGGKFSFQSLLPFKHLKSIHIELDGTKYELSQRFFKNNPNIESLTFYGTLPESAVDIFGDGNYPRNLKKLNLSHAYLPEVLTPKMQKVWFEEMLKNSDLEEVCMPTLNRDIPEEFLAEESAGFYPETLKVLTGLHNLRVLQFHDRINWSNDPIGSNIFCDKVLSLPKLESLKLSHFNEPPPPALLAGIRNAQQLRSVSIVRAYTESIDGLFGAVTEIKELKKFVIQTPPWTLRNLISLTNLETLSLRPMYCEHVEEMCQILNKNLPALRNFKFEYFGDQSYPTGRRELSVLDINRNLRTLSIDFSQGGYDVLVFRFGEEVKENLEYLQLIGPPDNKGFKGPDNLFEGLLLGCQRLKQVFVRWNKIDSDPNLKTWIMNALPNGGSFCQMPDLFQPPNMKNQEVELFYD